MSTKKSILTLRDGVVWEAAGAGGVVGGHRRPRRSGSAVWVVQGYRLVSKGELGSPAHPADMPAIARDYKRDD